MKSFYLILVILLAGISAHAQYGNLRASEVTGDSIVRIPLDTLKRAKNGSIAYKNGFLYYKDTYWKGVGISGSKFGQGLYFNGDSVFFGSPYNTPGYPTPFSTDREINLNNKGLTFRNGVYTSGEADNRVTFDFRKTGASNTDGIVTVIGHTYGSIAYMARMTDPGYTRYQMENWNTPDISALLGISYHSTASGFSCRNIYGGQLGQFYLGVDGNFFADSILSIIGQGVAGIAVKAHNNGYFKITGSATTGSEYARFIGTDGGRLGLKTATPDSTFHVVGGLKFVTGRQGAGKVLTSDANGGADWAAPSVGTDLNGIYTGPGALSVNTRIYGSLKDFQADSLNSFEFVSRTAGVAAAARIRALGTTGAASSGVMLSHLTSDGSDSTSLSINALGFQLRVPSTSIPIYIRNLPFVSVDTTSNKPLVIDGGGQVKRMPWGYLDKVPTFQEVYAKSNFLPTLNHSSFLDITNKSYSIFGSSVGFRLNDSTSDAGIFGRRILLAGDENSANNSGTYYNSLVPVMHSSSLLAIEDTTGVNANRTNRAVIGYGIRYDYNILKVDTTNLFPDLRATLPAGAGEANTASNLGGGLANYSSKSGVDLRFNSFGASDFDLTSNVIGIDYANGQSASGSNKGFLTSADWTTFNGKAASGANTDITSLLLNQTGLVVKGASANPLTIKPNETLSAARTLNIVTGDATRTLTFSADATIGGTHSGTSSGTNTGDQTTVTGNAGTATALQNARTIGGVSFDGTGNIVPQTIQSVNEATDATCFPLFITNSGSQSLQPSNNANLTFNSSTSVFGSTFFDAATGFRIGGAASSGKFLIGNGTNYVASTSTIPTSAGSAGKLLISDGTNYVLSTPTYPNASATTGKILKSDGTNFVASTETYAAPGTSGNVMKSDGTNWTSSGRDGEWILACSDETTTITTGTAKLTFRVPFGVTVTAVRASVNTVSSSGIPTFDINENGTTIISTKLTIDASEKTSTTAATAAVISDSSLADDSEITIDFDVAGTGAKGVKIIIYWTKS